jgi:hypothetical protein
MPGISSQAVILPQMSIWCYQNEACLAQLVPFDGENSETFKNAGLYEIPPGTEQFIENADYLEITGVWGVDDMHLGPYGKDLMIQREIIIITASPMFFIGTLGLRSGSDLGPENGTSMISSLRTAKIIPILAFSYTAGSVRSMMSQNPLLSCF